MTAPNRLAGLVNVIIDVMEEHTANVIALLASADARVEAAARDAGYPATLAPHLQSTVRGIVAQNLADALRDVAAVRCCSCGACVLFTASLVALAGEEARRRREARGATS